MQNTYPSSTHNNIQNNGVRTVTAVGILEEHFACIPSFKVFLTWHMDNDNGTGHAVLSLCIQTQLSQCIQVSGNALVCLKQRVVLTKALHRVMFVIPLIFKRNVHQSIFIVRVLLELSPKKTYTYAILFFITKSSCNESYHPLVPEDGQNADTHRPKSYVP